MAIVAKMPMSSLQAIPATQNNAPILEFRCLYTPDVKKKVKKWQDGRLRYHTFNKRVMVYDEKANFIGDTHWRAYYDLEEGSEVELDRRGIIVEVADCVERRDQDVAQILGKRAKEVEERRVAKAVNPGSSPAGLVAGRTSQVYSTPSEHSHLHLKPLKSILGDPSGHYGKALLPVTSPFEQRQATSNSITEANQSAKRRRLSPPTSRGGYAQNLTGATLSLSNGPKSYAPLRLEPLWARTSRLHQNVEGIDLTGDKSKDIGCFNNILVQPLQLQIGRHQTRQRRIGEYSPPRGYAHDLTGANLSLKGGSHKRLAERMNDNISLIQSSMDFGDFIDIDSTQSEKPGRRSETVSKQDARTSPSTSQRAVHLPAMEPLSAPKKSSVFLKSQHNMATDSCPDPILGPSLADGLKRPLKADTLRMQKRQKVKSIPEDSAKVGKISISKTSKNAPDDSSSAEMTHGRIFDNQEICLPTSDKQRMGQCKPSITSEFQYNTQSQVSVVETTAISQALPRRSPGTKITPGFSAQDISKLDPKVLRPLRIKSKSKKPMLLMSRSSSLPTTKAQGATTSVPVSLTALGSDEMPLQAAERLEEFVQGQKRLLLTGIGRNVEVSKSAEYAVEPPYERDLNLHCLDEMLLQKTDLKPRGPIAQNPPWLRSQSAGTEATAQSLVKPENEGMQARLLVELDLENSSETCALPQTGTIMARQDLTGRHVDQSTNISMAHTSCSEIETSTTNSRLDLSPLASTSAIVSIKTSPQSYDQLNTIAELPESGRCKELTDPMGQSTMQQEPEAIQELMTVSDSAQRNIYDVSGAINTVASIKASHIKPFPYLVGKNSTTHPLLSNPATRGKKAAQKSDQSLVLGSLVVADVPIAQQSTFMRLSIPIPTTMKRGIQPIRDIVPAIAATDLGPWSREAGDLFDWKPGGRLTTGT